MVNMQAPASGAGQPYPPYLYSQAQQAAAQANQSQGAATSSMTNSQQTQPVRASAMTFQSRPISVGGGLMAPQLQVPQLGAMFGNFMAAARTPTGYGQSQTAYGGFNGGRGAPSPGLGTGGVQQQAAQTPQRASQQQTPQRAVQQQQSSQPANDVSSAQQRYQQQLQMQREAQAAQQAQFAQKQAQFQQQQAARLQEAQARQERMREQQQQQAIIAQQAAQAKRIAAQQGQSQGGVKMFFGGGQSDDAELRRMRFDQQYPPVMPQEKLKEQSIKYFILNNDIHY